MLKCVGALVACALVCLGAVAAPLPAEPAYAVASDPRLPVPSLDEPGAPVPPADAEDPEELSAPAEDPQILGAGATVGTPVDVHPGDWGRDDLSFAFQWQVDGVAVPGATDPRFIPRAADEGTALSVVVTATSPSGASRDALSASVIVRPGLISLGAVRVSGSTIVGKAVTAELVSPAPEDATLSYQWLRNGSAIAGATAATYTVTAPDLGKQLSVAVRARQAGYEPAVETSAATRAVSAGALTTSKPSVTGTAAVGYTLTAKPGTWGPKPAKLAYQWLRNGASISKATGSTYRLSAADVGKRISVRVSGSLSGYTTTSQTSAQTATVLRTLTGAPAPTISGSVAVGKRLTARAGTWKPAPVALSFQWLRNGAPIKGATKSAYTLTAADGGAKITVRVTGKKSGYLTTAKVSAAKSVPRVLQTSKPKIAGTAQVGSRVTVQRGTWTSGAKLATQWLRNGAAIKGATGSAYTLTGSDAGKTISVRVTGSRSGYTSAAQTSAATKKVSYPARTRPVSAWDCPAWAPIKGNASSMIYHVKGGASYTKTKPEDCFSSAAAAQRAGYRASKR
ncbi:sunset domain-containing protein [Leucobacter komagatae]|uniref:sunset domain-containing protein n=1 Tax=Leucobacter komagatae TaxID=55969 RepID=UPI0006960647|nr:hypothetical protein [Leucobacter komagatae]